jgi:hypothetical protein
MFTRDEVLNSIIPYRLEAVTIANLVAGLRNEWCAPKSMKVYFDDRLQFTGSSNTLTNPVLEAGLIHCRALLDFLGLKVDSKDPTKLTNRDPKQTRPDDWVIEKFTNADGPLPMVTPLLAVSQYACPASEAEAALAGVLHTTNKGLAHLTSGLIQSAIEIFKLEIASRGIPALVVSHLYTPLGLPAPNFNCVEIQR